MTLFSFCKESGVFLFYLPRFATGLLMQEEESCPRSSEGRAMTLGGSQSADEAPRPAWLLAVRGRGWGVATRGGREPPEITSTWSPSPCIGQRTRWGTTLTTIWTTRRRKYKWWNICYQAEWGRSEFVCISVWEQAAVRQWGERGVQQPVSLPLWLWQGDLLPPTSPAPLLHLLPLPALLLHHQQALPSPALSWREAPGYV